MIVKPIQLQDLELENLLNWDNIKRFGKEVENISLITELPNRYRKSHIKSVKIFNIEIKTEKGKDIFYVALFECVNSHNDSHYTLKQFFNNYPSDQFLERRFDFKI